MPSESKKVRKTIKASELEARIEEEITKRVEAAMKRTARLDRRVHAYNVCPKCAKSNFHDKNCQVYQGLIKQTGRTTKVTARKEIRAEITRLRAIEKKKKKNA